MLSPCWNDGGQQTRTLFDYVPLAPTPSQVFVFGPDRKIWELDKGSATAGDALGRSYMQKFYEGALLHDRRNIKSDAKGQGAKRKTRTAWVNGREVCAVPAGLT